ENDLPGVDHRAADPAAVAAERKGAAPILKNQAAALERSRERRVDRLVVEQRVEGDAARAGKAGHGEITADGRDTARSERQPCPIDRVAGLPDLDTTGHQAGHIVRRDQPRRRSGEAGYTPA